MFAGCIDLEGKAGLIRLPEPAEIPCHRCPRRVASVRPRRPRGRSVAGSLVAWIQADGDRSVGALTERGRERDPDQQAQDGLRPCRARLAAHRGLASLPGNGRRSARPVIVPVGSSRVAVACASPAYALRRLEPCADSGSTIASVGLRQALASGGRPTIACWSAMWVRRPRCSGAARLALPKRWARPTSCQALPRKAAVYGPHTLQGRAAHVRTVASAPMVWAARAGARNAK